MTDTMRPWRQHLQLAPLFASGLMVAVIGYSDWVESTSPERFYQMVQEDGALEWASFWAFLLAALANVIAARRQRRARGGLPWFLAGLGLFCFLVAMEEISWGQRVLGYRPPTYFLEHNYEPLQHSMTWHLDYSRRSDIFDSVGYWYVESKQGGGSRVYYTQDTLLPSWIPSGVRKTFTKVAMRAATSKLEPACLDEMRAREARAGGWALPKLARLKLPELPTLPALPKVNALRMRPPSLRPAKTD